MLSLLLWRAREKKKKRKKEKREKDPGSSCPITSFLPELSYSRTNLPSFPYSPLPSTLHSHTHTPPHTPQLKFPSFNSDPGLSYKTTRLLTQVILQTRNTASPDISYLLFLEAPFSPHLIHFPSDLLYTHA